MILVSLLAALVPAFLLLRYFIKKDKYPEPTRLLVNTFVLGCLIVIPVVLMALPLMGFVESQSDPFTRSILQAFALAAIPEEAMKFWVVWFYCARKSDFDEPMDGFVYGATASLGFAALENVLYVMTGGLEVAVARALTAVPAHAFFGAIMGYYVSQAIFGKGGRAKNAFLALFVPILLHGLYDTPPMLLDALQNDEAALAQFAVPCVVMFFTILIGMWIWVKRLLRNAVEEQEMLGA